MCRIQIIPVLYFLSGTQEESLFRHTSLPFNLWPYRSKNDDRFEYKNWRTEKQRNKKSFYPINDKDCLYTHHCLVCRYLMNF